MGAPWRKILSEIIGVTLVASTVLLCVSLISHNPSDPSFNSYLSKSTTVSNYAGIIGATLSDMLVQSVGVMSWLALIAILYIGIALCSGVGPVTFLLFIGGFILMVGSLAGATNISWPADPMFSGTASGGFVGRFVAKEVMVPWFSIYGSYIILAALALSSILLVTRLSLSETAVAVAKFFWRARGWAVLAGKIFWRMASFVARIRIPILMETEEERSIKKKKSKVRLKDKNMDGAEIESLPPPDIVDFSAIQDVSPTPPSKVANSLKDEADSFRQEMFRFSQSDYTLPSLKLLDSAPRRKIVRSSKEDLLKSSKILEKKLLDFGIEGRVTQVLPGPVITIYEFEPAPGIKVSRIVNLSDDLAMSMRAMSIRILAPVPGKPVVGIEVPNAHREPVYLKELLSSDEYRVSDAKIPLTLGRDVTGQPIIVDLVQIPHLLIAGSTGSGKSVGINAMICSILYNATPDEVKFIMIDPKMLELSIYDGIPHLIAPVVTNPKKASNALRWVVGEMERRYAMLSELGVRNIDGYNKMVDANLKELGKKGVRPGENEDGTEEPLTERLPYIVVVVDELADLMMVSSKDVEDALARLAQMARAAGIHLIVATQRPSVDVLTGLIKANFPARISFQVRSRVDSRTIIDSMGAEKLLGKGDMLFLPQGASKLMRVQGPFVSDAEIHRVVKALKKQLNPIYNDDILKPRVEESEADPEEDMDELYDQAVELVARTRQASISMIQRRLRIGYNRAARIVEAMEKQGLVGPAVGVKPREVFVRATDDVETYN